MLHVLKLYYKVASSHLPAPQTLRVLKLYYKVASSQLPAPQIAPRTKVVLQRRQFSGVHPTPWQAASAAHSAHGHTEVHKVLCLPRNLHMKVHKVPATKSAHQAPVPGRRQGVHPTPWQAASAAHSTQMLPAERRCPADARAYIRPLGKQQAPHTVHMEVHKGLCLPRDLHTEVHKVLRLPRNLHIKRRCPADARAYIRPLGKQQAPHTARKCYRQSAGAQPTPGRTSDPLASSEVLCLPRDLHTEVHKVLRLPRKLRMKVHKVLRLPRNLHIQRRCPADARAYIRPLGKQQGAVPATRSAHGGSQRAAPATKSAHAAPVPSRRQGVHPTLKVHKVLRLPRNLHIQRRCPADARAYIRPLGKQQSAVPATRSAHGGSQSAAPATKSAHEASQSAAPATKSSHPAPVPSRRQGVHPTPGQAAKCCACHEICTRRFTKYCACHEICT